MPESNFSPEVVDDYSGIEAEIRETVEHQARLNEEAQFLDAQSAIDPKKALLELPTRIFDYFKGRSQ